MNFIWNSNRYCSKTIVCTKMKLLLWVSITLVVSSPKVPSWSKKSRVLQGSICEGRYCRLPNQLFTIGRPHGVTNHFFLFWCKDLIEFELQSKNKVNWIKIKDRNHFFIFGCFITNNNIENICSLLFPEWVQLGVNAFGNQILSLVPSK